MPAAVAWAFVANQDNPAKLTAAACISWASPGTRLRAERVEGLKAPVAGPHGGNGHQTRPPDILLLLLRLYQELRPGTALPLLPLLIWTLPPALELATCPSPAGGPKAAVTRLGLRLKDKYEPTDFLVTAHWKVPGSTWWTSELACELCILQGEVLLVPPLLSQARGCPPTGHRGFGRVMALMLTTEVVWKDRQTAHVPQIM
eukprot:CAMPEP_0172694470 /NCGR_PEP_ID=MMETSP1074-20121228/26693_1 /TAXON_ID=2916 /ORGANISM="Ceratium fusus, Strain PA161109" /LENGTH=201 /DNA_ID=CAMNT_0013514975 /DNA_START=782 /DNA_END=1388 /DNA_ORIENTATION=-